MEKYNYLESVKEDVNQYIANNQIHVTPDNREEIEEQLNEDLFVNDSVTGNASGKNKNKNGTIKEIWQTLPSWLN